MSILIIIVNTILQILVILVIVSVILSYVMDPYHPIRQGVDNIVQPMLEPIRRILPNTGMFDFSPLILLLLLQLLGRLLVSFLSTLR